MSKRKRPINSKEFKERVVDLCLKSGSSGLPRKARDRHIVLKSVAMTLDPHRAMTAEEVDNAIERWAWVVAQRLEVDRVTLRRGLVHEGYLNCDRNGLFHARSDLGPTAPGFSATVEELNVVDVALHGMCDIEQRRIQRFPQPGSDEGKKLIKARMVARQYLDGKLSHQFACHVLNWMYEKDRPFLSDLVYFSEGIWEMLDDENLARTYAAQFLEKSDEWVRWL
jgi:hypothetical protein